jgi:hypothetical protein
VCQGRERVLVKDAFCEGLTSIAPDRHLALKGFGLKACRISDAIAGFGVFGFNGENFCDHKFRKKAVLLLSEFFLCCFHLDLFWRMQDPCSEDKTVRECWIMVHG